MCDPTQVVGRFYLRFIVEDRPGVLQEIAGALGRQQISISSVIQHEPSNNGEEVTVPLVIMTHKATEGGMRAAIKDIDGLPCVRAKSVTMRVLD